MLSSTEILTGILHIRSVFTKEESERLIGEALQWPRAPARTYNGFTPNVQDDKQRKGSTYTCPPQIMHNAWFRVNIDEAVIHYLRKAPTPPIVSWKQVEMQLVEYDDPGDHFNMHRDCHLEADIGKTEKIRKVSMSIELTPSDQYEGCQLSFPDAKGGICFPNSEQGDITMFPSWHSHKVSPITSGVRRALIVWFHGPFWA